MRTGPAIDVTIAPGRFDRPDAAVTTAWEEEALHVRAILGTEATGHPFAVPGWFAAKGQGREGESFAAVDTKRFRVIDHGIFQITSGHGTGRFSEPTFVPWVACEDLLTGHVVVFVGAHLRAHLWPGSKHYQPGNKRTWLEGVRNLRRLRRYLRRRWPGCAILMGGDPNATHKGWFLRQIRRYFPNATVAWAGAFSSAWLWGLKVTNVRTIHPGTNVSDHLWKRLRVRYRDKPQHPRHTPDR